MRVIEYKGKKYQIDSRHCNKCRADAGANYCVSVCDYNMERLPVDIKWNCVSCANENINTDICLEDEYVGCSKCGTSHGVDVEDGEVINVYIED